MSVYRTAQGKMIDMSALATKNEKVRAVGNMHVNARGDKVDSNNRVISDGNRRVGAAYQKTVQEQVNHPAPARTTVNPNRINHQQAAPQQAAPQVRPPPAPQITGQHVNLAPEPIVMPTKTTTKASKVKPIELTPEEQEFEDEDDSPTVK